MPPIVRVNGHLYFLKEDEQAESPRLSAVDLTEMIFALMGPRQQEKYNNGLEVDIGYEIKGSGRYRLNICQQRSTPRIVCRHIPDKIPNFHELCLPPAVEKLSLSHRGLILVTGTTGSGKSTTLAAMVDNIARTRSCHVVTIEDPIEFIFKDRKSIITQREVNLDTQSFKHALKYSLRQDPDVILLGEMRDEETILMALMAAETGHLVLSTLHTLDATETINRIIGAIPEGLQAQTRLQLASVLVGVISQRLLKRADGRGRIAAIEILICNRRAQEIIADPKRTKDLKEVISESRTSGMQSFDQSLMQLFQQKLITREEALANCTNPKDFQLVLEGVIGGGFKGDEGESTMQDALGSGTNPNIQGPGTVALEEKQEPQRMKTGVSRLSKSLPGAHKPKPPPVKKKK